MDVKYGDNKKANISMTIKIFNVRQLELWTLKVSMLVPSKPLYIDSKIMTFQDIIKSEYCLLVLQQINRTLPSNLHIIMLI